MAVPEAVNDPFQPLSERFNPSVDIDLNESIMELAERNEVSMTEVIRRAVALYKYLDEIQNKRGRKITTTNEEDGALKEIVIAD